MSIPANRILRAAEEWLTNGTSIIPVRADGSKAPAISSWSEYQTRLPTISEIKPWFEDANRGIAAVCGSVSGNLEVLDFDQPGLYDEFAALCAENGLQDLLEACPLVETPSGGRHVYVRSDSIVGGNQKLAETADRKTLVETRGEGGYAIAPPSGPKVHRDGRPYRFLRGRPSTIPTITEQQLQALHTIARTFNKHIDLRDVINAPHQLQGKRTTTSRPGDDYNQRGDYETLLESRGWSRCHSRDDITHWRRSGKDGPGISATTGYAGQRLFYCFSSNAAPFEPNRAYTPFAVYALLEHAGDWALAAKALAAAGYGDSTLDKITSQRASEGESSDSTACLKPRLNLVCLADVQRERVEWLWGRRIPRGKVTIIDGDPGLGKSTLTAYIAARLTTGEPMEGIDEACDAANVLILTAEDGLGDTVRPRLEATGADLRRVHALKSVLVGDTPDPPVLPRDLDMIEEAIGTTGARLVIIDPFMAYIASNVDSHKDQDIRRVMARLADLAERTGAAIVIVRHLNKMTTVSAALYRGGGSIGIIGAVRSGLLVGVDPDNEDGRILAATKSNLCKKPGSLKFHLEDDGEEGVRVVWDGKSDYGADDLLSQASKDKKSSALDQATAFLLDALNNGPVAADDVAKAATDAGISESSLKRARKALRVQSKPDGFGGPRKLSLPLVSVKSVDLLHTTETDNKDNTAAGDLFDSRVSVDHLGDTDDSLDGHSVSSVRATDSVSAYMIHTDETDESADDFGGAWEEEL